ncbi:MAG: DsbA family protein [Pseudomonadota bacterium]
MSKRTLLTGAALVGVAYTVPWALVPWVQRQFPPEFEFRELSDPVGFRMFRAGAINSGGLPFLGLDGETGPSPFAKRGPALCQALFGTAAPVEGTVPVASFSDYRCPFCRVLTEYLAEIAEKDPSVTVEWHELPLLGPTSVAAARGALAAKRQGGYLAFHRRLMRSSVVATPDYLSDLAASAGLDPVQLVADARSEDIDQELVEALSLGQLFGFIGTPALVIGRTAVLGQIDRTTLLQLIDLERREGPVPCA